MSTALVRLPLLVVTSVVLHAAVFPNLRVEGIAVDFLLLVAVCTGIVVGPSRAGAIGFALGLLADCFLASPFGLSALSFSVTAYGVGAFHETVLHRARWIVVATAAVASAMGETLFVLAGVVLGQSELWSRRVPLVVAVVAVLNGLLAPMVIGLVRFGLAEPDDAAMVVR